MRGRAAVLGSIVIVLALAACGGSGEATPARSVVTSTQTPHASTAAVHADPVVLPTPPTEHPGGDPPMSSVHAACTSDLGGPGAFVDVWRDAQGHAAILELHPDVTRIPDAMTAFYDVQGARLAVLAIPMPASEEAAYMRARQPFVAGRLKTETIRCNP